MKNLIYKYKIFLYPLLVMVCSVIIIIFLIIPQIKIFVLGQDKLSDSKELLNILEVKASELEGLDEVDLSQKLSVALAALPVEKDFASLIGVFKGLATASGMSLTSFHLAGASEPQNSYLVRAELIGSNSSLGQLLNNIEKASRVMRLQTLETSTSGVGNTIASTVTVLVFFQPGPKTLGPIDSALPKLSETDKAILAALTKVSSPEQSGVIILPSGKSNPFE